MLEINGNIWDFEKQGWIVVTTNAEIRKDGKAVMGKGIAYQAAQKFPDLPLKLAKHVQNFGNILKIWPEYGIITYPTKWYWGDDSDLILIKNGAIKLIHSPELYGSNIYLPRLGCGCGNLHWEEVKTILEKILVEDRFIVISND